jgi:AraC-like DNA-binding protein
MTSPSESAPHPAPLALGLPDRREDTAPAAAVAVIGRGGPRLIRGIDEWRELARGSRVPTEMVQVASGTFRAKVWESSFGVLTLTEIQADPYCSVRTPTLIASNLPDLYLLALHLRGAGVLEQGDRRVELQPGDAVLWDSTRPFRFLCPSSVRQMVFMVSRCELRRLLPMRDGVWLVRRFPGGGGELRALTAYASELAAVDGLLTESSRQELGRTGLELMATMLRASGGDAAIPDIGRHAQLVRMTSFVAAHLAEPDLGPEMLAKVFGMSVRYVSAIFAEAGTSPARYIRERRLDACRRALADQRQGERSIAAISRAYGFVTPAVFTRAFERQFGLSPREYRRESLARSVSPPLGHLGDLFLVHGHTLGTMARRPQFPQASTD